MTRVLHVFSVSDVGGAEAVSLNIIRFREDARLEHAAALVTNEDGPLHGALADLRVESRTVRRGRMRNPAAFLRAALGLRRAIRELRPDVLIANSAQAFVYARLASLGLGLPVTIYYMAVPERRLWRNSMLDLLMVLGRPATIFTASRTIGEIVSGWGLMNVVPVYHGTAARRPTEEEERGVRLDLARLGIGEDDPVILMPGRLQPWKGQEILIEAVAHVSRAHPNAHAVMVGGTLFGMDRAYPNRLKALIERLSLERRVHLVGHRTSIRGWIERATIVVHASITPDAFPNVCIEAMAACRPLVTNQLSGTCEIVRGRQGALTPPAKDARALASALDELLSDPRAAAEMAQRGNECYLAAATPAHMVRPIESQLTHLALTTRAPRASGRLITE